MGITDSIKTDMATALVDFGVTVTYTPSNTLVQPFTLSGMVSRVQFDDPESARIRDVSVMRVRHADLVAGGVSNPTTRARKTPCDTVTIKDENGTNQVWSILDARVQHGWWVFEIERNTRLAVQ